MPGKKNYCFLFLILCVAFQIHGQNKKYFEITEGYNVRIVKNTNGNIHVWSCSAEKSINYFNSSILTLDVFSPAMQLIASKKIPLGKIKDWAISINETDSCYYASIFYWSYNREHLILQVDPNGNVTDVTDTHGQWRRIENTIELNRLYAIATTRNNLFAIKTENEDSAANIKIENSIFLGGENYADNKIYNKVSVVKVNIESQKLTAHAYASSFLNFNYPYISATDTIIISWAFAQPQSGHVVKNPYNGYFMLLSRLDSNLNETGAGSALLKISNKVPVKQYLPINLFALNNKLFFINLGYEPYQPRVATIGYGGVISSLRIMCADEKNNLLKDTSIEDHSSGDILWDNRFITTSDKTIDLFFGRRYRDTKNGIVHIRVDANGNISEEDMIVQLGFTYFLTNAVKADEGVILIPYNKRNKTIGILKLSYNQDDL